MDVLVATANNSAQTLEDLGESMKYVAPIGAEAGESVESTAKAIGVLANMQIKGSMAGTSLRKMLLSLADPAVQQKLGEIGVQAVDAAGDLRPVGDVLAEIGRTMAAMGSGQRLDEIEQQRQGALATLEEDRRGAHEERQARYGSHLTQQQRELQELIRQRDEAIAAAARAAEPTETGGGPQGVRGRIEDALAGLDFAAVGAGTGQVAGTFSAFAAARLGGSTAVERTAKATEETAQNTRKLEEHSRLNRGIAII